MYLAIYIYINTPAYVIYEKEVNAIYMMQLNNFRDRER